MAETTKPKPAKKAAPKAAPKPRGAQTRLTPETQDKIVTALKAGNYLETAAALSGIAISTLHTWLDKGRTARNLAAVGHEPATPHDAEYMDFLEAVEKARAEAEARSVVLVQQAAQKGTWQAAAWYLERTAPKRWGRKAEVELTGGDGGPVRIDVDATELERKLQRIIEKRTAQD